jgi:Domain of Unknown Function (DUF748)
MRKLIKPLLIFISVIIIIVIIVIVFISPITKYLVEKYDVEYMGREITMDYAYVNPFTGYIHFNDLKVFELESDSVFFSANGVSANIAMLKLFSKTYEVSSFILDKPRSTVIQNESDFNFTDLIKKFSSTEPVDTTKQPVHFNILNININDGEFYYIEKQTPINYFIKEVNFKSSGKRWDVDTIAGNYSLLSGLGSGSIKGDFTINVNTKDYRQAIVIEKFDLNIIAQYLKDLTNYGSFSAILDADVKANGNFKKTEAITASGLIAISDFHFGKNPKEDFASFDKLVLAIEELSPVVNKKFFYDSIVLNRPYFKYEKYDYLDNLQTMFGKDGKNIDAAQADSAKFNLIIEIAENIKLISKNFFKTHYKIDKFAITDANIIYNDFSTSEKFSLALNPMTFYADSIDKTRQRIEVFLKSGIKPYGDAKVTVSINPKDSSDFDMNYHFQKIPIAMFNPYVISQTSFPLDRGTVEFKGEWNVRNGNIKSDNHLTVIDPRVTKRIKNKDTKWIPVPLLMAFVRERGNVIDYQIPVTGNLNDPNFHLRDVIFDVLENIFVKPPTTPYRVEVKNVEREIEKSLSLKWEMRGTSLTRLQNKFVERMADFLSENKEASIEVSPQHFAVKEKEYILFFEAKKKYYLAVNNIDAKSYCEQDSLKIDKMSVKDSAFVRYVNKQINETMLFTIQEKCSRLIGEEIVNSKFEQLKKNRENIFLAYFKKEEVENRIKISEGEKIIPYNGFSFYKITYKGEFPEPLIEAYQKINDFNDKAPRKKYKDKRKKSNL